MPGTSNKPQAMRFDSPFRWFAAAGVPITPFDDAGVKNYYPMMRLVARNSSGAMLAKTDIVLPVSDELDCHTCHASGSPNSARPSAGWSFLSDAERDYKTNIVRLHDDRHRGSPAYQNALLAKGFNAAGLEATIGGGPPILCAGCHGSNALPGTGVTGISPLTRAVHSRHAQVLDPVTNLPLDAVENRSACYRCHPGSETKCLRGAMGAATASNGSMLMMSELSRRDGRGGQCLPHGLAAAAILPELPHRNRPSEQRPDSIHDDVRRKRATADCSRFHFCHQPQHTSRGARPLSPLQGARRRPVRGLSRIYPCRVSEFARQR